MSVYKLQSPSLPVYTVMKGAGRYSLDCIAEVLGLQEHTSQIKAEKCYSWSFPPNISLYFFEKITSNFNT